MSPVAKPRQPKASAPSPATARAKAPVDPSAPDATAMVVGGADEAVTEVSSVPSLLGSALLAEGVKRATQDAAKASLEGEHARIVERLHEAYREELPVLRGVSLRGDYGHPVPFSKDNGSNQIIGISEGMCKSGLSIHLGKHISQEHLKLMVSPRDGVHPPEARIVVDRKYPYRPWTIATFDGFTPPREMLKVFFQELAKHVVSAEPPEAAIPKRQVTVETRYREIKDRFDAEMLDLGRELVPGEDTAARWLERSDAARKQGLVDVIGPCAWQHERITRFGK